MALRVTLRQLNYFVAVGNADVRSWLQADSLGARLERLLFPRNRTAVAEQKKAPTGAGALGGGSDFDPTRSFRKSVQLAGAE